MRTKYREYDQAFFRFEECKKIDTKMISAKSDKVRKAISQNINLKLIRDETSKSAIIGFYLANSENEEKIERKFAGKILSSQSCKNGIFI